MVPLSSDACYCNHNSDWTNYSGWTYPWIAQTAGIDVVLNVREISRIGVVLLLMVLILLAVVRATSRIADAKTNLAKQLIGKTDAWYIATGEVEHASCMFR